MVVGYMFGIFFSVILVDENRFECRRVEKAFPLMGAQRSNMYHQLYSAVFIWSKCIRFIYNSTTIHINFDRQFLLVASKQKNERKKQFFSKAIEQNKNWQTCCSQIR